MNWRILSTFDNWWTHPTAHTSVAAYAGRGVGQGGQLAVAGTGTSLATTSKPGGHLVICLDLAGNIRQWHNIDDIRDMLHDILLDIRDV